MTKEKKYSNTTKYLSMYIYNLCIYTFLTAISILIMFLWVGYVAHE